MSMQAAFSPVTFGLNVKPRALKKATVRSRFLMGRLTKSLWDMRLSSFCSMDPPPAEKSSVARKKIAPCSGSSMGRPNAGNRTSVSRKKHRPHLLRLRTLEPIDDRRRHAPDVDADESRADRDEH